MDVLGLTTIMPILTNTTGTNGSNVTSYPTENSGNIANLKGPIDLAPEIYIPVSILSVALLLFFSILGIVFFKRIKRLQSVTREESGYYENFSKTTYQNERDSVSNKNVTKDPDITPAKIIDDPVYENFQGPIDQINRMNQIENIYGNVDYLKCPKSLT